MSNLARYSYAGVRVRGVDQPLVGLGRLDRIDRHRKCSGWIHPHKIIRVKCAYARHVYFQVGCTVAVGIGVNERTAAAVGGVPNRIGVGGTQIRGVGSLRPFTEELTECARERSLYERIGIIDELTEMKLVHAFVEIIDDIPLRA